jgi:hypothetical protein
MNMLAKHAYDRILKYGETDELYVKYFGNASSATAAGFYAQLLYGNKPGVLFRCDNPDGNCNESTAEGPWGENRSSLLSTTLALTDDAFTLIAGHHRGKNATEQTVICPPTCKSSCPRIQIQTQMLIASPSRRHPAQAALDSVLGRRRDRVRAAVAPLGYRFHASPDPRQY